METTKPKAILVVRLPHALNNKKAKKIEDEIKEKTEGWSLLVISEHREDISIEGICGKLTEMDIVQLAEMINGKIF